jgi:hypothetical protein
MEGAGSGKKKEPVPNGIFTLNTKLTNAGSVTAVRFIKMTRLAKSA